MLSPLYYEYDFYRAMHVQTRSWRIDIPSVVQMQLFETFYFNGYLTGSHSES